MKRGTIIAQSRQTTLVECPIGLFIDSSGDLCLKTEYRTAKGAIEAYIVETGEFFWGEGLGVDAQLREIVTPATLLMEATDAR